MPKLQLDGNCTLLDKIATDYTKLVDANAAEIPANRVYKINCSTEAAVVSRSARKAALSKMPGGFLKTAFDTRRIDQEEERNPRSNLQHWNRSAPFIEDDDQHKIDAFSKLLKPLIEVKLAYGGQSDYFNSYSRELYDKINTVLRLDIKDNDIYRPQLAYLEQLLFARYRLGIDEILALGDADLKDRILSKDEVLMKRGVRVNKDSIKNSLINQNAAKKEAQDPIVAPVKYVGGPTTQESIIQALFGANDLMKDGVRSSERTVTITIKDSVLEDKFKV